ADKWILSELDKLVAECMKGYSEYNFFIPATALREFTWNLFAAHYIEMIKGRAYGTGFSEEERDGAIYTLHKVLSTLLILLAPITPFITDYLWQNLYSDKTIHKERFVEKGNHEDWTGFTKEIVEFNSNVWNKKKELGLSLKDSADYEIPSNLLQFAKDLKAMHNLK
ncbi:MAG: class I tRNA ligase family protein, partial [Nitrosopumilaceae archaeon]